MWGQFFTLIQSNIIGLMQRIDHSMKDIAKNAGQYIIVLINDNDRDTRPNYSWTDYKLN